MKLDLIQDKLLQIFKLDNEKLLHDFVLRLLKDSREQALASFSDFMLDIQGRYRLKLLEILIEDGQKDLIPVFIEAVKHERNMLFSKSILFIYSNFEHSEALDELDKLADTMTGEMKASYQKAHGKLSAKFRHRFYLSEFHKQVKNPKRIAHAAEMMVKEPHPQYIPFLNEHILMDDPHYREKGIPVLNKIGDETSLDAIFKLVPNLFYEKEKAENLIRFLVDPRTAKIKKIHQFLERLGKMAGWSEDQINQYEKDVRSELTGPILDDIGKSFGMEHRMLWTEARAFLESILMGNFPDTKKRLKQSFETFEEHQNELLELCFSALGEIGYRTDTGSLFDKVDAYIPDDEPKKGPFTLAFLGGYRGGDARDRLLTYLEDGGEPEYQSKVLEALAHYDLDQPPEALIQLVRTTKESMLRKQALDLLIQWGQGKETLEFMMKSDSVAARADAIHAIAEFEMTGCVGLIHEELQRDLPASLRVEIIKALAHFPGDETGAVVAPFLDITQSYMVRNTATETLLDAGGEQRISLLTKALDAYPPGKRPEALSSFFKTMTSHLKQTTNVEPPHLTDNLDFWTGVLNDEKLDKIREQAVDVLELVNWDQCPDPLAWTNAINEVLAQLTDKRSYDEKRRLRMLLLKAKYIHENKKPEGTAPKQSRGLGFLLDNLDTTVHHDRVRAFRQLSLLFKPPMLEERSHQPRLIELVGKFFDLHHGNPDLMKIAITLAGKIGNSDLIQKISAFKDDPDPDLAKFAKAALANRESEETGVIHRVFVMDDSVMMTKMLSRFLDKACFEVDSANQVEKGLESLSSQHYDLLIVDFLMPEMNGVEFLDRARQEGVAPRKVIFITTTRDETDIRQIHAMGVDGLLLKPFSVEKLIDRIHQLEVA